MLATVVSDLSILNVAVIGVKCNCILFTKLPRPGESEGTFRFLSQAVPCLPHSVEALHCPLQLLNIKQTSCKSQLL